jgi:hypothetical protein
MAKAHVAFWQGELKKKKKVFGFLQYFVKGYSMLPRLYRKSKI